jgi:hypothetical protein
MLGKKKYAAIGFSTLLISGAACAVVLPQEAARLGRDLTPLGAELAGNADGSIPAWDPSGPPIPADFVPGSDNYTNPYAGEKPLFVIDGSNWQEYADNLTEGSKAVFEKLGQMVSEWMSTRPNVIMWRPIGSLQIPQRMPPYLLW